MLLLFIWFYIFDYILSAINELHSCEIFMKLNIHY